MVVVIVVLGCIGLVVFGVRRKRAAADAAASSDPSQPGIHVNPTFDHGAMTAGPAAPHFFGGVPKPANSAESEDEGDEGGMDYHGDAARDGDDAVGGTVEYAGLDQFASNRYAAGAHTLRRGNDGPEEYAHLTKTPRAAAAPAAAEYDRPKPDGYPEQEYSSLAPVQPAAETYTAPSEVGLPRSDTIYSSRPPVSASNRSRTPSVYSNLGDGEAYVAPSAVSRRGTGGAAAAAVVAGSPTSVTMQSSGVLFSIPLEVSDTTI